MKAVGLLLALLLGLGWLTARSGPLAEPGQNAKPAVAWRRTAAGWENSADWRPEPRGAPLSLHPGVVASFCLLASLLALAGLSPERGQDLAAPINSPPEQTS